MGEGRQVGRSPDDQQSDAWHLGYAALRAETVRNGSLFHVLIVGTIAALALGAALGFDGVWTLNARASGEGGNLPASPSGVVITLENAGPSTITEAALVEVLADTTPRYSILFALLAGTGLRIGEALALKTANLSPDCRVIRVRHTIWAGREQPPKTPNAVREVDVPEMLAGHLWKHVENTCGYLFPTASGKPLAVISHSLAERE